MLRFVYFHCIQFVRCISRKNEAKRRFSRIENKKSLVTDENNGRDQHWMVKQSKDLGET